MNRPLSALSRVIELTSANFDRTVRSSGKIFVDFWAPWCKPCARMEPVIERMASRHSGITFAKVNVEDSSEIASRFHISSLPAYLVFTNSNPIYSRSGAMSESELEEIISSD
jgi:thioredoxin